MAPEVYCALAHEVRAGGCDAILDFSAGDNGGSATHAERLAVVGTGAEIVSYSGGSLNQIGRAHV